MNPVYALRTRGLSLVENRLSDFDRAVGPLNLTAGALIALPAKTSMLGRKMASALSVDAAKQASLPAECGASVTASDPFIRYRGEYYHAHGCAETHPPALSRRRVRASQPPDPSWENANIGARNYDRRQGPRPP